MCNKNYIKVAKSSFDPYLSKYENKKYSRYGIYIRDKKSNIVT